jgi:hypothetical protein
VRRRLGEETLQGHRWDLSASPSELLKGCTGNFRAKKSLRGEKIDGQDLTEEFDKTRQPLDLMEVRGGYDHTRAQAREAAKPLDQQVISCQPLDLEDLRMG